MSSKETMPSSSIPDFTFSPSLIDLNVALKTYLSAHPTVARLIVCAIVIHNDSRVLLVQRAATDGFPHCWECPGGGVDHDEETILQALARELNEETGLVVRHVRALVDDKTEFRGREGIWRKITCLVEVNSAGGDDQGTASGEMPKVSLDPLEHQDFVWASEEDIALGRVGDRYIKFAYEVQKETIKVAFGMAKEGSGAG